jgi:hypothetical protein
MMNHTLIEQFESDNLPGEFHHADHVQLAFAYLSVCPPLEALDRFSRALKRYAEARGKSGLYHDLGHSYLSIRVFPDNVSAFDEFKGVEGSGKIYEHAQACVQEKRDTVKIPGISLGQGLDTPTRKRGRLSPSAWR